MRERAVHHWLDPSGTVTITGSGLSVEEAAAACARLDRLATTIRRAGHPRSPAQISADLYAGSSTGCTSASPTPRSVARLIQDARNEGDIGGRTPTDESTSPDEPPPADEPAPGDAPAPGQARSPKLRSDRRPIRDGVEIRVGLATLIGLDDRPGEVPGLGPVLSGVARRLVAAQRSGAEWRFAVVDDDGHLRDVLLAQLDARPDDRFAHAALARHIQVRDRTCTHVRCTRPARACDLDHTRDFTQGGTTTRADLGPGCLRHHRDKHVRHWQPRQPRPGQFVWRSPLGRIYRTRGEPIMPPLPGPAPRQRPPPPRSERVREPDTRDVPPF